MVFLRVNFRTFVHATESEEKVRMAFLFVTGERELKTIKTEGHHGNPLTILEAEMTRSRDIRDMIGRLKGTGILEELIDRMDERMDDSCALHFRVDKAAALDGRLELASDKNFIDVSMKTGAYPSNKGNACTAAREFLESVL